MSENWEEIDIGPAQHKSSLLARVQGIQQNPNPNTTKTPISPVETVQKEFPKKSYKFKISIVTFLFVIVQLCIFLFTDQAFEQKKKNNNSEEVKIYLDMVQEAITSDTERIVSDVKQFSKTKTILDKKTEDNFTRFLFPPKTNYLYFGVYSNVSGKLNLEEDYYNENEFNSINLDFTIFKEILDSNEINFLRSGNGNTYIHNLSVSGKKNVISVVSVPLPESRIALLSFDSTHWNRLLTRQKPGTTFILNDINSVISHSDLDVAITGPDYSELDFLKFILLEKPHSTSRKVPSKTGKFLSIGVRKIIQTDSYLVFLAEENTKTEILHPETSVLYISSCIVFLLYSVTIVHILRKSLT